MGHREDLLAGAVRCLREKGYGRTTARDIVAASGASERVILGFRGPHNRALVLYPGQARAAGIASAQ